MKIFIFSLFLVFTLLPITVFGQNVGIGESSPATQLDIKGHTGADLLNVKTVDDSTRLYVTESGNVGIGTATPSERLQVLGDAMIGSGNYGYYTNPAGVGALTQVGTTPGAVARTVMNDGSGTYCQYLNAYYDGSDWKYNYGTTANRFVMSGGTFGFYVAASGSTGGNISWKNGLFIDNDANVGIGTGSSPGSKLDVKGTIRISGSTSGYVGLAVPAAAGSTTYTLPAADGTNGQALCTDGSGNLTWNTASGGETTKSVPFINTFNSGGGKSGPDPKKHYFFGNSSVSSKNAVDTTSSNWNAIPNLHAATASFTATEATTFTNLTGWINGNKVPAGTAHVKVYKYSPVNNSGSNLSGTLIGKWSRSTFTASRNYKVNINAITAGGVNSLAAGDVIVIYVLWDVDDSDVYFTGNLEFQ